MNIEFLKHSYTPVGLVEIGDCFLLNNQLYMKTNEINKNSVFQISCVCLNNGSISVFKKETLVEVINIEIREIGSK